MYKNFEVKQVANDDEYAAYVNYQNGRSGMAMNSNLFIKDLETYKQIDPNFTLLFTDNIIDVGCRANATVVCELHKLGYKNSYGIDIGEQARILWNNLPDLVRKNLKRADAHDGIPWDFKFKVITCSHTLEHCYDPALVIQKFYESLVPDGLLHIQIPLSKYKEFANHNPHYAFWDSEDSFKNWIQNFGFEVKYTESYSTHKRSVNDDLCIFLTKK